MSQLVPVEFAHDAAEAAGGAAAPDGMGPRLARLHTAELCGQVHELYDAWLEAARGWVDLGAFDAAQSHYERALCWGELLGSQDAVVDLLCELAELCAVHGERREREKPGAGRSQIRSARVHALDAARRASQVADGTWEIHVLLRVSDVLDRCGRREEALELQVRAVRLMAERRAG